MIPEHRYICPECGKKNYHVDTIFTDDSGCAESKHLICKECGQEYFTDIDYNRLKESSGE